MSADQQQDDFIFDVENNVWRTERPKGHPKIERDELATAKRKKEVEARKIEDQLSTTVSSIREKKLHDGSRYYYVIEADLGVGQGLYSALRELSVKVHAYLDREHSVLLVSSSADKLDTLSRRTLPFRVKAPILKIRLLALEEHFRRHQYV